MAICFVRAKICTRGGDTGGNVIASSAYQSGETLIDSKTGELKRYSRKERIIETGLELPTQANFENRQELWESVEMFERAKNAQLARKFEIALPREISREQQIALARRFIRDYLVAAGMCADWAIHDSGDGNPHLHIMCTMRALDEFGNFLPKSRKIYVLDKNGKKIYDKKKRQYKCRKENTTNWDSKSFFERLRKNWIDTANNALRDAGRKERIEPHDEKLRLEATLHEGDTKLHYFILDENEKRRKRNAARVDRAARITYAAARLAGINPAGARAAVEKQLGNIVKNAAITDKDTILDDACKNAETARHGGLDERDWRTAQKRAAQHRQSHGGGRGGRG